MGTLVEFTESDLLRSKIVDPAWYRLLINEVGEWTPTKNGDSNNCVMECVIQFNGDTRSEEFKGVPLNLQFNDKKNAIGFIEGFLRAMGAKLEVGRIDLQAVKGSQIEAYVENETWEGRVRNRVNHKYRAVRE